MDDNSAIVIGGGLVGSLCACLLAERGYKVTLYEKREDIRKLTASKGRSINLALSHRGRKALRLIGLEDEVLKNAIPMSGRLLHSEKGDTESVKYDPVSNQCIYSVGRNFLNQALLDAAQKYTNLKMFFNHKVVDVDFNKSTIEVTNCMTNDSIITSADFIIGADGAFSVLRGFMQKMPRFNFSQDFIDHGYLELCVPAKRGDQLRPNHLHIWPRGQFMMIALPNQDNSWTVTLFMPFEKFAAIDDRRKLIEFFESTFPDALPLIGEQELESMYFKNAPSALVSIKCGQYDMGNRFLIIGDAAHAMVPFYGQGMNAGFEDCTLLNELLNQTQDNVSKIIKLFTQKRQKDAFAICDLAMYNYIEMRDLVTKPTYKLRKIVDGTLAKLWPEIWVPLYNSVSFSHMEYSKCVENKSWQDEVLLYGVLITIIIFAILILVLF
ncbi:unnamed protein product [Ceutorhynchus assimilis]|uniref:Kynurenine 3-monooxygenase n=1 Tax=Ceutorhynchus assimilis TaxID=467358 RepID=A0A9N9MWN7_9CUCU|nr:unnamed protein product [Ceutorhynchus assimilis]